MKQLEKEKVSPGWRNSIIFHLHGLQYGSAKTRNEAIKLYKELSRSWGKAGMHARKWISNKSKVLKKIPGEDREMEVNLESGEFPSVKTLGILCKAKDEVFTFQNANTSCCKESDVKKSA